MRLENVELVTVRLLVSGPEVNRSGKIVTIRIATGRDPLVS